MKRILTIALVLCMLVGIMAPLASAFSDVADSPEKEYISTLAEKGIVKGYNADTFAPDKLCTREQFITFLYRAAGEPEVIVADEFADMRDADDYAKAAMKYYKSKGAIEGVGNNKFLPQANITRAEAVVMVAKCLEVK